MIDPLNAIVARLQRHNFCQGVICISGIVEDSRTKRLRKWAAVALLITVTGACTTRGQVAASPAMSHPQLLPAYSGMSDGPDVDLHPHDKSLILADGLLDGSVIGQRFTDRKESVEVRRQGRSCTQCL